MVTTLNKILILSGLRLLHMNIVERGKQEGKYLNLTLGGKQTSKPKKMSALKYSVLNYLYDCIPFVCIFVSLTYVSTVTYIIRP